jgi:hypothetical protein
LAARANKTKIAERDREKKIEEIKLKTKWEESF